MNPIYLNTTGREMSEVWPQTWHLNTTSKKNLTNPLMCEWLRQMSSLAEWWFSPHTVAGNGTHTQQNIIKLKKTFIYRNCPCPTNPWIQWLLRNVMLVPVAGEFTRLRRTPPSANLYYSSTHLFSLSSCIVYCHITVVIHEPAPEAHSGIEVGFCLVPSRK